MKKTLLVTVASMALCANAANAQSEQFVEIVSSKSTGDWRITLNVEDDEEKPLVWVDLNNNGTREEDESIGMWEWYSYSKPRNGDRLKIYGPISKLSCSFNDIIEIKLENNSTIKELECTYSKGLTSIDLSANKSLKKVSLYGCKLNLVKLPESDAELEMLDVNDNELTAIDVNGCSKLEKIFCFSNKLAAPAMQNIVDGLVDRSGMEKKGQMFVLKSVGQPEENEILKSTVLLAKKKNWDVKYFNGQTDYEGSDHSRYVTTLPKASLATSLKDGAEWAFVLNADDENRDKVWIDFNGNDLYDYGEEQAIFDEEVHFPVTNNVVNIYGDLNKLVCKKLMLTSLNVEGMENLQMLDCSHNAISELNLSKNTKLTNLFAYENQINNIDLSANVLLSNVSLNSNKLENISLSNNNKLSVLFVSKNQLSTLDVSACTELAALAFENNKIEEINLSGNTKLETLYCKGNNLSALNLSALNAIVTLSCENNKIQSLKLPNSPMLSSVYCFGNQLKGEAMSEVCRNLPVRNADKKGVLFVVDTKGVDEGNECTSVDVETAMNANWNVYDYCGNENGGYNPYGGIVTAIDTLENTDKTIKTSYFNSQGIESEKPFKGLNIVIKQYNDGSSVKEKIMF